MLFSLDLYPMKWTVHMTSDAQNLIKQMQDDDLKKLFIPLTKEDVASLQKSDFVAVVKKGMKKAENVQASKKKSYAPYFADKVVDYYTKVAKENRRVANKKDEEAKEKVEEAKKEGVEQEQKENLEKQAVRLQNIAKNRRKVADRIEQDSLYVPLGYASFINYWADGLKVIFSDDDSMLGFLANHKDLLEEFTKTYPWRSSKREARAFLSILYNHDNFLVQSNIRKFLDKTSMFVVKDSVNKLFDNYKHPKEGDSLQPKEAFNKLLQDKELKLFVDDRERLNFLMQDSDKFFEAFVEKTLQQDRKLFFYHSNSLIQRVAREIFEIQDKFNIKVSINSKLDFFSHQFVPMLIFKEFSQSFNSLVLYDMQNVPLHFWVPNSPKDNAHKLEDSVMKQLARRARTILFMQQELLDKKEVDEWNIILLPSKFKKIFPKKGEVFSRGHINSAETNSFIVPNSLTVFRREEMSKTFVHEMFHRINIEKAFKQKSEDLGKWCLQYFAIKPNRKILANEALTEALASIANVVMSAYEVCLIKEEEFDTLLKEMWNMERIFSLYQSAKMLFLSGFDTFDEFFSPSKTEKRVVQDTAAAEYHILKAMLVYDINRFLGIVTNKDIESISKQQEAFKNLIFDVGSDKTYKNFRDTIDSLISYFKNNEKHQQLNLFKTGRMTIVEALAGKE